MDDIRMVVRRVVEAYLKKQMEDSVKPSIALLLGYQSSNPLDILKAVAPLQDRNEIGLILSRDWLKEASSLGDGSNKLLEETSRQELAAIIEKTSALVIPAASYRLVSKLALSIDDDPAVWMAIRYQMLGKPIIIAKDEVELNVYQQILAPTSVQERFQSYIRQLRADQVQWVPLTKLSETVADQVAAYQEKQSLILAKHVEKAYRDGLAEINMPEHSKVTPSAKDRAKELKIRITNGRIEKGGTS